MQPEADSDSSEGETREVDTPHRTGGPRGMGNQAQRRSLVRRTSAEGLPAPPIPPVEQTTGQASSPTTASRSPPRVEYDFIGPFGKKQRMIRDRVRLAKRSRSKPDISIGESSKRSKTRQKVDSPKRRMARSPKTASSLQAIAESTVEPLNLSMHQRWRSPQQRPITTPGEVHRKVRLLALAVRVQRIETGHRPARPLNALSIASDSEATAAAAPTGGNCPGTVAPPPISGPTEKGKDKYKCEECGKEISQLRNFRYHQSRHEGTNEFACSCPICGKAFNDNGYLSNHLKIHENAKEYKCEWCERRFNQRAAYNMHVRIHTGHKPHPCHMCPKAFSRKTMLQAHLRAHTGERPFTCPNCPKSFADRSNMLLHQRIHTGERPYCCEMCGKSFSSNHSLKTHMNQHYGIRPYSCSKCHSRFSQSGNMRVHLKKCTGLKQNLSDPLTTYAQEMGGPSRLSPASASAPVITGTSCTAPGQEKLMNNMNPMINVAQSYVSSTQEQWQGIGYGHCREEGASASPTEVISGPGQSQAFSNVPRRVPPSATVTKEIPGTSPGSSGSKFYGTGSPQLPSHYSMWAGGLESAQYSRVTHSSNTSRLEQPTSATGPLNSTSPPIIPLHQLSISGAESHCGQYAGPSRFRESSSQYSNTAPSPPSPSRIQQMFQQQRMPIGFLSGTPQLIPAAHMVQLSLQRPMHRFIEMQAQQMESQLQRGSDSIQPNAYGSHEVEQQQQQMVLGGRQLFRQLTHLRPTPQQQQQNQYLEFEQHPLQRDLWLQQDQERELTQFHHAQLQHQVLLLQQQQQQQKQQQQCHQNKSDHSHTKHDPP